MKLNILLIGFGLLLLGCNKEDIPPEKYLIFEDQFVGDHTWSFIEVPDDWEPDPGFAEGEIIDQQLFLNVDGCSEVTATLPITDSEMTEKEYKKITVVIDIAEFSAGPLISNQNRISIGFKNFNLVVYFKRHSINDLVLVFNIDDNEIELVEETELVDFAFNTNPDEYKISAKIRATSAGDCIAGAHLKLNSIKIYRK